VQAEGRGDTGVKKFRDKKGIEKGDHTVHREE